MTQFYWFFQFWNFVSLSRDRVHAYEFLLTTVIGIAVVDSCLFVIIFANIFIVRARLVVEQSCPRVTIVLCIAGRGLRSLLSFEHGRYIFDKVHGLVPILLSTLSEATLSWGRNESKESLNLGPAVVNDTAKDAELEEFIESAGVSAWNLLATVCYSI